MPTSLSLDIRQRATQSYFDGEGKHQEIAARFKISPRTLTNWIALVRVGESLEPLLLGGTPSMPNSSLSTKHAYDLIWVSVNPFGHPNFSGDLVQSYKA